MVLTPISNFTNIYELSADVPEDYPMFHSVGSPRCMGNPAKVTLYIADARTQGPAAANGMVVATSQAARLVVAGA